MPRTYKPASHAEDRPRQKAKKRKIAIYYRQSDDSQVGNQSTAMQTEDKVAELVARGIPREDIILIDLDAGVSGTLGVDEREGLSKLVELIKQDLIELVIVRDVQRLFRDDKQIETNSFIFLCQRHDVKVETSRMTYDFNDEKYKKLHIRQFREEAAAGADYIEGHIKGVMHPAKERLIQAGKWAGQGIPTGFMVDDRKVLKNGRENPHYRQLFKFWYFAKVVLAYYLIAIQFGGNMMAAWNYIDHYGPYFPDDWKAKLPPGFRIVFQLRRRSPHTGGLTPCYNGLLGMMKNAANIGHFVSHDVVLYWYHHKAIVPEEVFFTVFNYLSGVTLLGEPNPDYIPHRPYVRDSKADQDCEPPTYEGLIFSDDMADHPHCRLAKQKQKKAKAYSYRLAYPSERRSYWAVPAKRVDPLIDEMIRERLACTLVDEAGWQQALKDCETGDSGKLRPLQQELKAEERKKQAILAGISSYKDAEMRQAAEEQFEACKGRLQLLQKQLERATQQQAQGQTLQDARQALDRLVHEWEQLTIAQKRDLFGSLAAYATISAVSHRHKQIMVVWRDETTSERLFKHTYTRGQPWPKVKLDSLKYLIESQAPQVEILRQFPGMKWRNLLDLYAAHFNHRSREGVYKGEKRYPQHIRWEDTEEYRQESELQASCNPSTTVFTRPPLRPFDWFTLAEVLKRWPAMPLKV